MEMEKAPTQSKKFLAFLISEMTWKVVVLVVLWLYKDSMPTAPFVIGLASVVIAGFVEVGYLGGQTWLDRYVRVAKIAADAGTGFKVPPGMEEPSDKLVK